MLSPDHVSTIICINIQAIKYSSKINRICCENRTYFLFLYKNQTIPSGIQIRKNFDVSVTVKYSQHFVELQWHVDQNKIAVSFLKITFNSLEKVTSLLGEKFVFFCHCFKIFEIFLFDIFRTRLQLKTWSPYKS